ncbi:MAG: hypothetical protein LWW87_07210 [Geobacteraceae bacterium]|nr:hypothetical protein [Geobacteraceae bacterium]
MAAKRKLPDIDAFGAMLDRAFPAGPLSDVAAKPVPEPATPTVAPTPTPPITTVAEPPKEQNHKSHVKEETTASHPANQQANKPVNYPASNQGKEPTKQQTNKPDNEPVKHQGNKQTNKPTKYQANESVNTPVSQPVDNPAISGHAANQPASYPVNYQANNVTNKPVHESDNEPVIYPVSGSAIEAVNHQINKPVNYPVNATDPELWYPFTEKQGKILLYLIQAGGITKREHISNDTGVNIATVKHTLRVLAHEGYINNIQLYTNHSFRGFSYGVNRTMCAEFAERLTGQPLDYPDNQPINHPTKHPIRKPVNYPVRKPAHYPTNEPGSSPDASFSSSKKELNLTTTENHDKADLLRDSELAYWKDKGISNRKINDWAEEFQMSVDQVIQSLKYCRYEMVVLNQEEEKQIAKPDNWFYKIMQRSGVYPKPANYKSLTEIRAEQMEQAAREMAEARERQIAAEQELAFQKILENPAGEEYQALLQQVSEFAREMGGKALETAMREAFKGN